MGGEEVRKEEEEKKERVVRLKWREMEETQTDRFGTVGGKTPGSGLMFLKWIRAQKPHSGFHGANPF